MSDDVEPVIEGVVIGHAVCMYPGCTNTAITVTDPYVYELDGIEVEIDICESHLQDRYDDI